MQMVREGGERKREGKAGRDDAGINFFTFQSKFTMTNEDVYISYLPLAHMMERVCQAMVLQSGGRIGFFRGDIKLLIEDIQALKPTLFLSVPRLLNRIYDKVGVQLNALKDSLESKKLQFSVKFKDTF